MDETNGIEDKSTNSGKRHSGTPRTNQRSRASTQQSVNGADNGEHLPLSDMQQVDAEGMQSDNGGDVSNSEDEILEVVSKFYLAFYFNFLFF